MQGELFIFEGPDGVGKSTLVQEFSAKLTKLGRPCTGLAFPGNDPGTLGHLVYRVHDDPGSLGVSDLTPISRQILHVAAHAAAIQNQILPALLAGRVVVLDRYWWSTWVYGLVDGAERDSLQALVDLELKCWQGIRPTAAILVDQDRPWKPPKNSGLWRQLRSAYLDLVKTQEQRHLVLKIANNESPARTVETILEAVPSL